MSLGASDRIEMNQRELDILTILKPVLTGERSQVEAAALGLHPCGALSSRRRHGR
jgi:hypothetical protein